MIQFFVISFSHFFFLIRSRKISIYFEIEMTLLFIYKYDSILKSMILCKDNLLIERKKNVNVID